MKLKSLLKDKKGVAGLEILKAVIVSLFIIGILIMVFAIMGSKLKLQATDNTSYNVINTTTKELGTIPNWFGIIIVITVMVVLIFLVSMIIRAVRGSGVEGA